MPHAIDATHNPHLRSWVASANQPHSDFPIQNLPFGVFRQSGSVESAHIGVAIGDQILDLALCVGTGLFSDLPQSIQLACAAGNLNSLMALGRAASSRLRHRVSELLSQNAERPPDRDLLLAMADADLLLPATIGDYTDFYASIFHATNVGKLFRPDNPLLPNYKSVPIAYHGRSSSIVPSGTSIKRPQGQRKGATDPVPQFGFTQLLDYELEVGFFVSTANALGESIAIDQAEDHIFGLCLVNDWSARDIQAWEYQPLGPFLSKSFATTVSPWVVTLEALAPFRCPDLQRDRDDPPPLPYLATPENREWGGVDLTVETWLWSYQMRQASMKPVRLSRANFQQMYWTLAQMLTHHASNGCNLRSGDLLASGTVSGASPGTQGCLLEMTQRGSHPITLPTGEVRSFLEDGDEVILRGYCEKPGFARIGFGECRGRIL